MGMSKIKLNRKSTSKRISKLSGSLGFSERAKLKITTRHQSKGACPSSPPRKPSNSWFNSETHGAVGGIEVENRQRADPVDYTKQLEST